MPSTVEIDSPFTGITHSIDFDSDSPTPADIDYALSIADAPILASQRLSRNQNILDVLQGEPTLGGATVSGGDLINPETDQPVYSPEFKEQDRAAVKQEVLANRQAQLQQEAQTLEEIAKTGKLGSLAAGAGTVPLGLAALVQAAVEKAGGRPQSPEIINNLFEEATQRASVNPVTGAVGAGIANYATLGSPAGTIKNLLAGRFKKAAGEAAINAPINMAVGTTIRKVGGQETEASDLAVDALLALVGGKHKPMVPGIARASSGSVSDKVKSLIGFNPTPFEAATKGLRPSNKLGGKWNAEFVSRGLNAVKDLGDVDVVIAPKSEVYPAFVEASNNTLGKLSALWKKVTNNPNAGDLNGEGMIRELVQNVATDKVMLESRPELQRIVENLKGYRRQIPLDEAERLLQQTNEYLEGPLYNRTLEGQSVARSHLETKTQEQLAQLLRKHINDALEKSDLPEGAAIKQTYGAVATLKREAQKRYLVALRQAQNNLPEQLANAQSAADLIEGLAGLAMGNSFGAVKVVSAATRKKAASYLREINSSEEMLRTAFDKTPAGKSGYVGLEIPPVQPPPKINIEDLFAPPTTAPAGAVVPATFEGQIQELIRNYPPSLQRDPELARRAAEAQLTGRTGSVTGSVNTPPDLKKKVVPENELELAISNSLEVNPPSKELYKSPPQPKLLTRSVESADLPTPETVNDVKWYHGSSSKNLTADTIDPVGRGKSNSLFGLGFYVTDDASIANSYQIGKSRGKGFVYQVDTSNIRKILNFDKPLPQDALEVLSKNVYSEFDSVVLEAAAEKGATGSSIWKKLTEAIEEDSAANMTPVSEYEEMFQNIQGDLRQKGYDAITHVGGIRAGKSSKTHKVLILLDPNDFAGYAGIELPKTIKNVKKIE